MKNVFRSWLLAWCAFAVSPGRACGPFLPEQILVSPQVILRTPVGDFAQEVMALTKEDGAPALPPGMARVAPSDDEPAKDDAAELAELAEALDRQGTPLAARSQIIAGYQAFRATLKKPAETSSIRFDKIANSLRTSGASPASDRPELPEGLPPEWNDYLDGAARFWAGDLPGACAAWERLLARPPTERLYCSTRAAFMLARVQDDPAAAAEDNARRYRRVREVRLEGARDLFNLGSQSLGWEGRIALDQKDYPSALRLYYLQAVTDAGHLDRNGSSLRDVVTAAMAPAEMAAAARDPFLRKAITLCLACSHSFYDEEPASPPDPPDSLPPTRAWLEELNKADPNPVREAVIIAWAAYKAADYTQAAAWLEKAPADDAMALWLRAKLALRDGKVDAAPACFARALRMFPAEIKATDTDCGMGWASDGRQFRTNQFHTDLGILSLSRSDFAQALTALLRSGFWRDAAYVAERVMTVDELRAFVRANFPVEPPRVATAETPADGEVPAQVRDPLNVIQDQLDIEHTANPAAFSLRTCSRDASRGTPATQKQGGTILRCCGQNLTSTRLPSGWQGRCIIRKLAGRTLTGAPLELNVGWAWNYSEPKTSPTGLWRTGRLMTITIARRV